MTQVSSEEINRNQFTQHNYKSKHLGGCYTYDWNLDGPYSEEIPDNWEIFELRFESVPPQQSNSPYTHTIGANLLMIRKPILIAKDGQRRPFKIILNKDHIIIYRGLLKANEKENSRVRYWRPAGELPDIAERIRVTETWYPEEVRAVEEQANTPSSSDDENIGKNQEDCTPDDK